MPEIVIAHCGGFWGDDPTTARGQVRGGRVDYLVMDYLAEITMAILQEQRSRRPEPATPATSSPSCARSYPTAWSAMSP
jgi:hypothetical protein